MSTPLPDPEALVRAMADAMRGNISADAGMVGIYTGGAWIAERLHRALALATPLGHLAVTLHRDDFGRIGLHRESRRSQIPFSVDAREIILVDDVLHTGRTIRAALNELFGIGKRAQDFSLLVAGSSSRKLCRMRVAASASTSDFDPARVRVCRRLDSASAEVSVSST